FKVVFELRVSIPIGVLRNTMPAFVRQTEPCNTMEGSTSLVAVTGGLDWLVAGVAVCEGGSSAEPPPARAVESASPQATMPRPCKPCARWARVCLIMTSARRNQEGDHVMQTSVSPHPEIRPCRRLQYLCE